MEVTHPRSLVERMIAAAKLEVTLYEEVEADASAMSQAAVVVTLAAIASAIGAAGGGAAGLFGGLIGALLGWIAMALLDLPLVQPFT